MKLRLTTEFRRNGEGSLVGISQYTLQFVQVITRCEIESIRPVFGIRPLFRDVSRLPVRDGDSVQIQYPYTSHGPSGRRRSRAVSAPGRQGPRDSFWWVVLESLERYWRRLGAPWGTDWRCAWASFGGFSCQRRQVVALEVLQREVGRRRPVRVAMHGRSAGWCDTAPASLAP